MTSGFFATHPQGSFVNFICITEFLIYFRFSMWVKVSQGNRLEGFCANSPRSFPSIQENLRPFSLTSPLNFTRFHAPQIRFNHVLQLKKQPFNSGTRTFRQVGRALILVWIGHSQFPSHSTIQNGFESTASARNLPPALFFLSQSVARSLLFVLRILDDSNCSPFSSSSA